MALGGITPNNILEIKDYGFGGAVVMGDLWNKFNACTDRDYLEVIRHFKKLKKWLIEPSWTGKSKFTVLFVFNTGRQREIEGGAFPFLRLHTDTSPIVLHNRFGDGKPQPRTFDIVVHLHKPFKDGMSSHFIDTTACICHIK